MDVYLRKQQAMKNNLPPIALQLTHLDAFFYECTTDGNTVSGLFEAHWAAQPFSVGIRTFLDSAYTKGCIADYDEKVGRVYISDQYEGTDPNAVEWIQQLLEFDADTTQKILKHAVWAEWEAELARLRREIASGVDPKASLGARIHRTYDTDFCDAILRLAEIIEAVNEPAAV